MTIRAMSHAARFVFADARDRRHMPNVPHFVLAQLTAASA